MKQAKKIIYNENEEGDEELLKSPFFVTNLLGSQASVIFGGERITVIVLPKAERWKNRVRALKFSNKKYTAKRGP